MDILELFTKFQLYQAVQSPRLPCKGKDVFLGRNPPLSSMYGVKLGVCYDSESIPSRCFVPKNIPWAKNGSHQTVKRDESSVKSDESSLKHSFVGRFLTE